MPSLRFQSVRTCLPRYPTHRIDQFCDLLPLPLDIATGEGIGNAMRHVTAQNFGFHLMQRGTDRIDLRQDVDAVAVYLHHPVKTPNLAFDPLQASQDRLFCCAVHACLYTPHGYMRQAEITPTTPLTEESTT